MSHTIFHRNEQGPDTSVITPRVSVDQARERRLRARRQVLNGLVPEEATASQGATEGRPTTDNTGGGRSSSPDTGQTSGSTLSNVGPSDIFSMMSRPDDMPGLAVGLGLGLSALGVPFGEFFGTTIGVAQALGTPGRELQGAGGRSFRGRGPGQAAQLSIGGNIFPGEPERTSFSGVGQQAPGQSQLSFGEVGQQAPGQSQDSFGDVGQQAPGTRGSSNVGDTGGGRGEGGVGGAGEAGGVGQGGGIGL